MSILHKPNHVVCSIIMPEGAADLHSDEERNIPQLCCNQNAKKIFIPPQMWLTM